MNKKQISKSNFILSIYSLLFSVILSNNFHGSSCWFLSELKYPTVCSDHQVACADGTQCVVNSYVCDGERDCSDGSDEMNCSLLAAESNKNSKTIELKDCTSYEYMCKNRKCIWDHDVCDGEDDCGDRSDERNCPKCSKSSFNCGGDVCIPKSWRCDKRIDCPDGSDEKDCQQVNCTGSDFQCANGKCVSKWQRCNSNDDCGDRSDEKGCTTKQCLSIEFDCGDHCIPKSWRCDNQTDCNNNSDEADCPVITTCGVNQLKCNNGKCIDLDVLCNGYDDCGDRSDENSCTITRCGYNKFDCGNTCIPYAWRCDQQFDCENGLDELTCPSIKPRSKHLSTSCSEGTFSCSDKSGCMPLDYRCDGYPNCRDGSDEKNCLGTNYIIKI